MKNLSLILNAVLFILVGILFYLHFNGKKSAAPVTVKSLDGKTQAVQGQVIAYFDIDSFQNNYTYYKQKKHEIETKQNAIESEMARDEKKIQSMIEGYQMKAETMTEEEYYIAQQKLAVEQASEAYKIRKDRFGEGLEKTTDLLMAENQLLQEEIGLLQAVFEFEITQAYLAFLTK